MIKRAIIEILCWFVILVPIWFVIDVVYDLIKRSIAA